MGHIRAKVQNRQVEISFVPTAAPLIIEALKEKPRDRKKEKNVSHNGNIKLDDVIRIAKTMRDAERSMAIEFAGTVKEILGTCCSLQCTIRKVCQGNDRTRCFRRSQGLS